MNVYEAICAVMGEVGAIQKNKKNQSGQPFMYRGVDDVMNALQPAMVKYGLFIMPEILEMIREDRTTAKGNPIIYSICKIKYTFYSTDGTSVSSVVTGEAFDSGDKATNKAMSIAFKYVCFQVFCIPTDEMLNPDAVSHQIGKKPAQNSKPAPPAEPDIQNQKIDAVKVKVIMGELERTGVHPEAICKRYNIASINDLPEGKFQVVMNVLQKTKTLEKV